MSLRSDTLLRALASFGRKVTTKEVAAHPSINRAPRPVGARLGHLADYGKVDREVVRSATPPRRFCVWSAHV
jgi:hypothetical protein